MGDYNLSGLSTRSFERLVQALASKILGPGLVVFGDGPDGGREATFEGRVPFPSESEPWDGYCVVQAKFRQRPGDPKREIKWALQQLEKELKDFVDASKRRRNPDYYIFATNLVLTPVARTGGKDQFAALIKKYQKQTKLRDWRVWDFDQIGTFLDGCIDVRHAYSAWITPGDVLAQALQHMQLSRTDFLEAITNFLAKDLLRDQFANLGQAGHASEQKVPLAQVFVDLLTAPDRLADPPDEAKTPGLTELISELIGTASERLDQSATSRLRAPDEAALVPQGPEPGRYVLVGGPGQGKTTVSQFVCQLFRAAILSDRPTHLLSVEVRQVISGLLNQCAANRPQLPKTRRFPVRIVLSSFAAALKAAMPQKLSLLEYITKSIDDTSGHSVSQSDLRRWLSAYPWLIVLDGLDEVPPSTNREDVLRSVRDFWVDTAQLGADVLVLATTRPQGYNDDFSPDLYHHLWLVPLSAERALHYADRLAESRWGYDRERRGKVMSHLTRASTEGATARLMRSPLQVTIMATLVDQIGPPPQDRWRLFHLYYDVIYRREQERDIPAAEMLRNYRADIDAIHSYVALVLQIDSERAGGTEARLSRERLAGIVTTRLKDEGQVGASLEILRERIIDAAANRLVFLVGLQEGQIGFEIRSLQEFMASEALMSGNDNEIQSRLGHIAPISSWRNVFLFAAGRCFALDQHRRDTISTLCAGLNTDYENPLAQATLAGSVLALDLLEEGLARRQPKYARLLADLATRILDLPPSDLHDRLADAIEERYDDIYRQALDKGFQREFGFQLGSWATLLPLFKTERTWVKELGDRHWPTDQHHQMQLFELKQAARAEDWLLTKAKIYATCAPPAILRPILHLPFLHPVVNRYRYLFGMSVYEDTDLLSLSVSEAAGIELSITPLKMAAQSNLSIPDHPEWSPVYYGMQFAKDPSRDALAGALASVLKSHIEYPASALSTFTIPWVFTACLNSCKSDSELEILIYRVKQGELGDKEDWHTAERRWKSSGITVQDLLAAPDEGWPFDRRIGYLGSPLMGAGSTLSYKQDFSTQLDEFLRFYDSLESIPRVQKSFSWMLLALLTHQQPSTPPASITPSLLEDIIASRIRSVRDMDLALLLLKWTKQAKHSAWLHSLDLLGRRLRTGHIEETTLSLANVGRLLRLGKDFPGALRFVEMAVQRGLAAPKLHIQAEALTDPVIQRAALTIELSQGVTDKRAGELAQVGVALSEKGLDAFEEISDTMIRQGLSDTVITNFLLTTYERLADKVVRDKASVIREMINILRRRKSTLAEGIIWRSLALPNGLLDYVTTNK
jgi:hypothetical protein